MNRGWFIPAVGMLVLVCIAMAIVVFRAKPPEPPAPIVEAEEPQTPVAPTTTEDPVIDLFNPSQASLDAQINASALKNQLEDLIVLTFALRQCGYLNDTTYAESFHAIGLYTQRKLTSGDQQWQSALASAIESASASYGLLYARNACQSTTLSANAAQLTQWRTAILSQPSPAN